MSMENAILAHAAALSELAAAVRALVDSTMGAVVTGGERIKGHTAAEAADKTETPEKSIKGTKADTKAETKTETKPEPDTSTTDTGAGDEPTLDYNKDVKPVLLAAIKRVGKESVGAMIKTFGVEKADQVDPAKYQALVDAANALEKAE